MAEFADDLEKISDSLEKKQENFDRVMQLAREIIRLAGQTITLMHNNEKARAEAGLGEMQRRVAQLGGIDADQRHHSMQAYQEYAEAFIFFSLKTKRRIPTVAAVGVDQEAYLMGLMDVVGELKREVLESLRGDDLKGAERCLDAMKQIYDGTRSMRFAEAVLSGFRKKQDVARIQIEGAGGEILNFRSRWPSKK